MFKTAYNHLDVESQGEINSKPSMTIPDQSLTIKQIVQRFASGRPLGGQRVPVYEGDEVRPAGLPEGVDIHQLELTDRMNLLLDAKAEIDNLTKNNLEKAAAKEREQLRKSILEEIEKTKKEITTNTPPPTTTTETKN